MLQLIFPALILLTHSSLNTAVYPLQAQSINGRLSLTLPPIPTQIQFPAFSFATTKIPDISISMPSTVSSLATAKLNIATPQIDFSFPTDKLAQAGSVFQSTIPTQTIPTSSSISASSFSNSTFSGFSDSYKAEMAYLIASITSLNTSQGRLLSDKLTMSLISIDNTLKLINMNKSKQTQLKPLLQFQVKQFLGDIDLVQAYLSKQSTSVIVGDSNLIVGKGATVEGDNNVVVGSNNAVLGSNNALIGNQGLISGFNNGVSGSGGVVVGVNNAVSANNAFVFANDDVVSKDNLLVVRNTSIDLGKLATGGSYITRN